MFPVLAPRSVNLVQTFHNKKTALESRHRGLVMTPALNLQMAKDGGSVDGVYTRIPPDQGLAALELASENLYSGISMTRCISDDTAIRKLIRTPDKIRALLKPLTDKNSPFPRLSEILPPDQNHDFWWGGVSCSLSCPETTKKTVNKDYETNSVNFYKLYTIDQDNQDVGVSDHACRDGCAWQACVRNGAIGLYEHQGGAHAGFYLVCTSAIPSLGSEIVRAMKSDLTGECDAYSFTDSKEMWLLQNLSQRNRLRCLKHAADLLGIKVHVNRDPLAHHSQAGELQAVETLGVLFENLYVDETSPEMSVVHEKGCLDASRGIGPIPLLLGSGQDIIVFHPESPLRSVSGLDNDLCCFSQKSPSEGVRPFPVVNIQDRSMISAERIEQETNSLRRLNIHDISHNIHSQHQVVSKETARVLGIVDNYGSFMFFGMRYEEPLPLLLCPNLVSRYVLAEERAEVKWTEAGEKSRRRKEKRRHYKSAGIVQRDFAEMLFLARKRENIEVRDLFGYSEECNKPATANVVLAWEQNLMSVVAQLVCDGTHGLDLSHMKSIASVETAHKV